MPMPCIICESLYPSSTLRRMVAVLPRYSEKMIVMARMMAIHAVIMKDRRIWRVMVRIGKGSTVDMATYTSTGDASIAWGRIWRIDAFGVLEECHCVCLRETIVVDGRQTSSMADMNAITDMLLCFVSVLPQECHQGSNATRCKGRRRVHCETEKTWAAALCWNSRQRLRIDWLRVAGWC